MEMTGYIPLGHITGRLDNATNSPIRFGHKERPSSSDILRGTILFRVNL
jgi:hypothetical protein